MSISLNGSIPLGYRIGNSDRELGEATDAPDGFLVLNLCTGSVFEASGGVWVSGSMDADLLAAWYATTTSNDGPGLGYRIGTEDRALGEATDAPEGFLVLNTTNNACFEVSGGVWVDGGTFPSDLLAAWNAA